MWKLKVFYWVFVVMCLYQGAIDDTSSLSIRIITFVVILGVASLIYWGLSKLSAESKAKYPGYGYAGEKCDYCGSHMNSSSATSVPHLGGSVDMSHNRYFCTSRCLKNWKSEHGI